MSAPRRTKIKRTTGIYKSSSGSYEFSYRDSDGRLRFETVAGDLEAAKAARADRIARLGKGERVAPDKTTFEAYGNAWLEKLTVRPSTVALYRSHFRKHLVPTFGSKPLSRITVNDVAGFLAEQKQKGLSPYTIRGQLTVLSRIMRHAERAGLITMSPVRKLETSERPASSNGERRSLDSAEIKRLLAISGRHKPLVALGAFSGLRISEALGLVWEEIDYDAGVIHVRKQLGRDHTRADLKTGRARRDVVLIPEVAMLLKEHWLSSRHKAPGDLVFIGPGGKPRDHRAASRTIERLVEKAKLPEDVTFHTLRHAFASMLISGLKLDIESVSRQLGHASSAITLSIYSHEFEAARNVDSIRDALSGEFNRMAAKASS